MRQQNKKEIISIIVILCITYTLTIITAINLSNQYSSLKYLEDINTDLIQIDNNQLPYNLLYEDLIKTNHKTNEIIFYITISFLILISLIFIRKFLDLQENYINLYKTI